MHLSTWRTVICLVMLIAYHPVISVAEPPFDPLVWITTTYGLQLNSDRDRCRNPAASITLANLMVEGFRTPAQASIPGYYRIKALDHVLSKTPRGANYTWSEGSIIVRHMYLIPAMLHALATEVDVLTTEHSWSAFPTFHQFIVPTWPLEAADHLYTAWRRDGQRAFATSPCFIVSDGPTPHTTKLLQQALTREGYTPGPCDGHMRAQTREALQLYQRRNGSHPTGYLDSNAYYFLVRREET